MQRPSSAPGNRSVPRSNDSDALRRSITSGNRPRIQSDSRRNITDRNDRDSQPDRSLGSQIQQRLSNRDRSGDDSSRSQLRERIERSDRSAGESIQSQIAERRNRDNGPGDRSRSEIFERLNRENRSGSNPDFDRDRNPFERSRNQLPGLNERRQLADRRDESRRLFDDRRDFDRDTWRDRINDRPERRSDLQKQLVSRRDFRPDGRTRFVAGHLNHRWDRGRDWWRNDRWRNDRWRNNRWRYKYVNHRHWHRGFRYPGAYWNYPWRRYSGWAAFNTTLWGINQLAWNFGYWGYSNPYCYGPVGGSVVYDYSQPILVTQSPAYSVESGTIVTEVPDATAEASSAGLAAFDASRESFLRGDYSASLVQIEEALVELPDDPVVHEFRGLVLFALGQYDDAAETLYAVLAAGPGWDWSTMSSLYPDVQIYTDQLRSLEAYVRANPDSSQGHFVLGYHYLTCGHEDAATRQLKEVLRLTPGQKVATDLLTMLLGPEAVKEVEGAGPPVLPPPAEIEAPPITPEQIRGSWKATGPDDSAFELVLEQDGSFTWKFERDGRSEQVQGVWALDGNTLAMEPDTGGTMLAELSSVTKTGFTFRMAGASADDEGLLFRPQQ